MASPLGSFEDASRLLVPRDKPVCGGQTKGTYNTPLHVIALLAVLVFSTLACGFPLIVKRYPGLRVPSNFLFLARHFGTGVLLATAFVHLLPTAFISLTDPCLPDFWIHTYPAMAGAIALGAVFLVVVVEMIFSSFGVETHSHGGFEQVESDDHHTAGGQRSSQESQPFLSPNATSQAFPKHHRTQSGSIRQLSQIDGPPTSGRLSDEHQTFLPTSPTLSEHPEEEGEENAMETTHLTRAHPTQLPRPKGSHGTRRYSLQGRPADFPKIDSDLLQQKKNLLQVALLEAGILFHSVFIGMALSVATGSNFIVLFIAILFHQTFEGLALGARIASITLFERKSLKPWMMCLAYGTTTPIGQAIGLATHTLYDPASKTGLLMVGTMNAISSGLLLFAGLVELLAEDFLTDESWKVMRGKKRVTASLCVFAGAFGMAFIGAFA